MVGRIYLYYLLQGCFSMTVTKRTVRGTASELIDLDPECFFKMYPCYKALGSRNGLRAHLSSTLTVVFLA